MASRRVISFSKECDQAAERLGGYKRLDKALDAIWDGLNRNPYEFLLIEGDYFSSARVMLTEGTDDCPPLVWIFAIRADRNVEILYVEEQEGY